MWHVANGKMRTKAVDKTLKTFTNESKSVKIHEKSRISRNFTDFTKMGVFHWRRPISRKISRPWNRELGWSLDIVHYICCISEIQTMKLFTVCNSYLKWPSKVTQHHQQCHPSLERLDFLAKNGKVEYTSFSLQPHAPCTVFAIGLNSSVWRH